MIKSRHRGENLCPSPCCLCHIFKMNKIQRRLPDNKDELPLFLERESAVLSSTLPDMPLAIAASFPMLQGIMITASGALVPLRKGASKSLFSHTLTKGLYFCIPSFLKSANRQLPVLPSSLLSLQKSEQHGQNAFCRQFLYQSDTVDTAACSVMPITYSDNFSPPEHHFCCCKRKHHDTDNPVHRKKSHIQFGQVIWLYQAVFICKESSGDEHPCEIEKSKVEAEPDPAKQHIEAR